MDLPHFLLFPRSPRAPLPPARLTAAGLERVCMHERCTLSGLLVAARHCSRNRFPPHAAMGLHGLQCGALSLEARAASASTSSAGDDRRKNPKVGAHTLHVSFVDVKALERGLPSNLSTLLTR